MASSIGSWTLRMLLFLLLCVMGVQVLVAQIGGNGSRPGNNGIGGVNQPPPDSLRPDSLVALPKNITIKTLRINPDHIFHFQEIDTDTLTPDATRQPVVFPTDTLPGFSQTLGFTGKPVLRWVDGRLAADKPGSVYLDPFFRQTDPFIYPNAGYDHYDTHTPYLNLDYSIGPRNYQFINGVFSRSIGPRWNLAGRYAARSGNAPYANFVTANRTLNFNGSYNGPQGRYYAFAKMGLHDNKDEINGGIPILEGQSPVDRIQKQASSTFLSGAQRQRLVRTISLDQHYRLFGLEKQDTLPADSLNRYTPKTIRRKLNLRLQADISSQRWAYGDQELGDLINVRDTSLNFPYPHLNPTTTSIQDTIRTVSNHIEGSVSYQEGGSLMLQAGLGQILRTHRTETFRLTDSRPIFWGRAKFTTARLQVNGDLRREGSTLFAAETFLGGEAIFRPFAKDTTPGFLTLSGGASVAGHNPSVFQRYYIADTSQAFPVNNDLINEGVVRVFGEVRVDEQNVPANRAPRFASLRGFLTRTSRPIFYDESFVPLQGVAGSSLSWVGVQAKAQQRIGALGYFDMDVNWQQGTSSGDPLLRPYTRQIPRVFGKLGLYIEDKETAYGRFRVGGELRGFSGYRAFSVDAFSGEFFPSGQLLDPYARLDLLMEIRFKNAFVWFRMQHANELLIVQGYFSTPFYAEQERMLVAGISWTFFD